jgi:hypothetical protein
LVQAPAFTASFEGADKGDELVGDHTERNLSDIELMAGDQLEQEVEWAIKVIEVDAKTALRSD